MHAANLGTPAARTKVGTARMDCYPPRPTHIPCHHARACPTVSDAGTGLCGPHLLATYIIRLGPCPRPTPPYPSVPLVLFSGTLISFQGFMGPPPQQPKWSGPYRRFSLHSSCVLHTSSSGSSTRTPVCHTSHRDILIWNFHSVVRFSRPDAVTMRLVHAMVMISQVDRWGHVLLQEVP